jgi:hypothetical protein
VEGEKDLMVFTVRSKSRKCFMAETIVDARKADVEDVGRLSGGKYQVWAQFQPWPLRLKDSSHASHKALQRVGGCSGSGLFSGVL